MTQEIEIYQGELTGVEKVEASCWHCGNTFEAQKKTYELGESVQIECPDCVESRST